MTFHSKATFAGPGKRPLGWHDLAHCILLITLLFMGAEAGRYSRSSFTVTNNGTTDSNLVLENGALGLAIDRYETVTLQTDSMAAVNRNIPSHYPDVVAASDSGFAFLWADQFGINRREYRIGADLSITPGTVVKIGDLAAADTNLCFLHGTRGPNGDLASYVYRGNFSQTRLRLVNTAAVFDLDSSASNLLHQSLCAGAGDTFYLAYAKDFQTVILAKVYAHDADLRVIDTVLVATQTILVSIYTPSVAADTSGNVLVTWLEGGQATSKDLYFRVFDRNFQPLNNKTLLAANSASRLRIHYYDHAPAAAYGPGRFAAASWDSAGVLLHQIRVTGATVERQTTRIVNRPLVHFTAVAAHARYLLVMCKGDADGNGVSGVEGYRYNLAGGEPDLQNGLYVSASAAHVVDTANGRRFSASLNCTFNAEGNFAVTWRSAAQVRYSIFATPPVRHRRGFWTSPVESLSVDAGDSARFYPPAVTISSLASWYVEDSIRAGCTPGEFTPAKPWISFSSDAALSAARTGCRYFQFRVALSRRSGAGADSIATPRLSAITFPWNAKPRLLSLDSLLVTSRGTAPFRFDSTVTVISRRDSVTAFLRLRDADASGNLRLGATTPALDAEQIVPSHPDLFASVRLPRIVKSDTIVTCTVSVIDSFAWQGAPGRFTVATRNSLPLLSVGVVTRGAGGGLDTTSLFGFRQFGVQEDDSIAFLYSVADTNDSATVRAFIRRIAGASSVVIDSTSQGAMRRYAVRGGDLPVADSLRMEFLAVDPDTSVQINASVTVNHLPHITAVRYDTVDVREGDSIRVTIGKQVPLRVTAHDTDLVFWDTLRCGFFTGTFADSQKNMTGEFTFQYTPDRRDTLVTVVVRDRYGKSDTLHFYCEVVNHPPRITGVQLDGKTVGRGDSVRVDIGRQVALAITAADTDLVFLDTMHFRLTTRTRTELSSGKAGAASFALTPAYGDAAVSIVVHDIYGGADTLVLFLKYPWLSFDDAINPGYHAALDSLRTALSLVDGSDDTVSVLIPFVNSGSDSLYLTSITFLQATGQWLTVGVQQGSGETQFGPQNAATLQPVLIAAGGTLRLTVYATARVLTGDSVISGRFVVGTSDYAHRTDTVMVRLEHNDLPFITDIVPDWDPSRPYTVSRLQKKAAYASYSFPPHASLMISFSEPVDSASAVRAVSVHSIFDSAMKDSVVPLPIRHIWSDAYTRLRLFADYTGPSPYFSVTPPSGLFVPTDSLALVITPDLVDRAATPSGPNRLDINRDYRRDSGGDTTVTLRVDSITFCVLAVSPADGDTTVSRMPYVDLTFSAPVLGSSVDTSRSANRSLIVRSRYNDDQPLSMDSVSVAGNRVRYYPGRHFFYRDSVSCLYRAHTIRDRSGFPIDNTGDGIPGTLFDSLSTAEDLSWRFRIRDIRVVSVSPESGDTVLTTGRPLTLTFSDRVAGGSFDTSLVSNRSFQLRSRYSGADQSSLRSIVVSADSMTVTLVPVYGYFSSDSLHCSFYGFANDYRYAIPVYPGSGAGGFSGFDWYFKTGVTGFYTYPNPYKPGNDPRHCRAGGPCGIWFKNIHTLTTGMVDFRIVIYTVKGYPLFDSRKARGLIHFDPGEEPQWLWDTRNQRGELVASGLYFYVVYDALDRVLVKGKLMIAR